MKVVKGKEFINDLIVEGAKSEIQISFEPDNGTDYKPMGQNPEKRATQETVGNWSTL